ncbi:ErfK/YbiS/YcfS/YnhG family protein/Tat domain protein [Candidatus Rhodobacter oscarellae]|uniref:ErfK/YbiS/YcfS/YnhG family protein/Tat domain protein n=1 Tax=Candidatus Rhodobacter oscarellae TaxID=1675527 RepID=A0A0J9E9M9_9RHOB|nr:L,D-transpeptidase [Candidatus Rhodobacter lobularis]KMW59490.1 ErfK/YbiS/YcfS/YnhG family protein/Tat domain protein [Candidatus Rhodobacter lobularis]
MTNRRDFMAMFGAAAALPSVALARKNYEIPPEHMPVEVRIKKGLEPGVIHVDPNRFYLYWTMEKRKAIRYVVGVGRHGLYESGEFTIGAKKEWPSWKPTESMIERNPAYKEFENGVPGGPTNPLGSRALYLFNAKGADTFLRIHGTPQPWTLGQAVSNGCARLANSHIEHLYQMVPKGTRVVLYPQA